MLCRRALSIFLLVVAPVTQAANLCFFPGGKQAADVPCDLKAQVSMCCGSVAACLSNGLCKDEKTTNETGVAYARGTCTDPTWQSPICPQHCQLNQDTPRNSSAFDFRLNGVQMWECDAQGYGNPANYCCESAAEKTRCCATQSAVFRLAAATPGNALAIQTYIPPVPTPTTLQTAPAPTSGLDSARATSTGAPVPGPAAANSNGPLDRNGLIAVGVGAGLGGAALASIVVMLLVRRMTRRDQTSQVSAVSSQSDYYYQGPPPGSQAGDVAKWQTLTRYDTAEMDRGAGHARYWAAAEAKDGMDPYRTPRLGTPNESPVMGRPSPTAQFGVGLGLDKRPLPPTPESEDPNPPPGKKQSIYEMPGW
ncbi:hypothetical protein MCOR27_002638 [Pyricularia oryzae]|uniref:Mid2 domain-containing protein n=4 Tax=Pyricularia TaxID=48558 RepID=A0ABQ8NKZ8_PYRGI|nr:uncharacterized protein MGG_05051 [Pyricularia oryzae 70-15]ELQ43099.1 hypothetical protein OOU_Y34scaffold00174g64 [Pyricularia oryzae Y34]KAH8847945.1 hypothetical protein MCOR01_001341 [Pyricularia oryzae]KAI6297805.1 hypothetical protein MCOR33_005977 [Pyricularia grisea]EHA52756.1 hypothetical protein MGG_05051 [Pyricularia oryzae 70-15]KAH9430115.1 hypothetical protein MCOR02_009834 [Pyricularia oryzae]